MNATDRLTARPLDLIRRAAGSPQEIAAKLRRLAVILAGYARGGVLDARLDVLHRRGLIDVIPTRVQLAVGAVDMLRFWISLENG